MTTLILSILILVNSIITLILALKMRRMHKDFAIVERLLEPFLDWIAKVEKLQGVGEKMAKQREEAFNKISTRKANKE